jgi:hypothetical protein
VRAEVAEAIRHTRRTLAEKTWVPHFPNFLDECCLLTAIRDVSPERFIWGWFLGRSIVDAVCETWAVRDVDNLVAWNDRQTDVGAVLGMTLQALIAELCKPTSTHHREGVTSSPEKKGPRGL